jgi:hypothetical protein
MRASESHGRRLAAEGTRIKVIMGTTSAIGATVIKIQARVRREKSE